MDKRNPKYKKTKDKGQALNSPRCTVQSSYDYKNADEKDEVVAHNVTDSLPVEKRITRSKRQGKKGRAGKYKSENVETSDIFKPVFEVHHENESFQSVNHLERITMKEKIFSSVNEYKDSKVSFSKIYHRWLPERQNTLTKLRSLLKEIHEKEINYYKTRATFKEFSYNSRICKENTTSETIDFFASLAAFVSDAASGITSFAQAAEMDSYQTTFQEIMDNDAEITKGLYDSRSQCIVQYQGVEEVIRKFDSNTLTSTVDKISGTLHVDKHWAAMKNAYEKDDMPKLLNEVCKFFDNACQSEVLEDIKDSVQRYVSDNPAALEVCKSTGRVVYGAVDTFGEKKGNRNPAFRCINLAANSYLMLEDKKEVDHLNSLISEDTHQSKLESQIEEAIESLEAEMKEMNDIYFQQFSVYYSD